MATSYKYFKEDIKDYLKEKFDENATILDVGAGEGTYYNLLHDYFKNIDGVEIWLPNISGFNLAEKYREVYNIDIRDFKYTKYNIIIFGDIIEHLSIEDARKVLKYAYNMCDEMIIAVPYMCKQDIAEDNVYEIHKQDDLTPELVLKRYPMLKLLYKNDLYGYYVKEEKYES